MDRPAREIVRDITGEATTPHERRSCDKRAGHGVDGAAVLEQVAMSALRQCARDSCPLRSGRASHRRSWRRVRARCARRIRWMLVGPIDGQSPDDRSSPESDSACCRRSRRSVSGHFPGERRRRSLKRPPLIRPLGPRSAVRFPRPNGKSRPSRGDARPTAGVRWRPCHGASSVLLLVELRPTRIERLD